MGGVVRAVTNVVSDVVESVGDVIKDVGEVAEKVVNSAVKLVENTVQGALSDPIGTIAKVAAVATGNAELLPLINAGDVVAHGGSLDQALLAAGTTYVGQGVANYVSSNLSTADIYDTTPFSEQTQALAQQNAGLIPTDSLSRAIGAAAGTATKETLSGKEDVAQIFGDALAGGAGSYVGSEVKANTLDSLGQTGSSLAGNMAGATTTAALRGQDPSAAIGSSLVNSLVSSSLSPSAPLAPVNKAETESETNLAYNNLSPADKQFVDMSVAMGGDLSTAVNYAMANPSSPAPGTQYASLTPETMTDVPVGSGDAEPETIDVTLGKGSGGAPGAPGAPDSYGYEFPPGSKFDNGMTYLGDGVWDIDGKQWTVGIEGWNDKTTPNGQFFEGLASQLGVKSPIEAKLVQAQEPTEPVVDQSSTTVPLIVSGEVTPPQTPPTSVSPNVSVLEPAPTSDALQQLPPDLAGMVTEDAKNLSQSGFSNQDVISLISNTYGLDTPVVTDLVSSLTTPAATSSTAVATPSTSASTTEIAQTVPVSTTTAPVTEVVEQPTAPVVTAQEEEQPKKEEEKTTTPPISVPIVTPSVVAPSVTTTTSAPSQNLFFGAAGDSSSSSAGALPKGLSATYLPAAPAQGTTMNLFQLKQLYPQLSTIDPKLLSLITGKPVSPLGSLDTDGTHLSVGNASAPSPGYPSRASGPETSSTSFAPTREFMSGNYDALSSAGLRAMGALPSYGLKKGGKVKNRPAPLHIPEFKTGTTGHFVQGRGDGQSDDIPAMLADGEYVFDADTVAALGNGSSKAGALVLDKMRENIRKHKRSAAEDKIPPKAKSPLEYLKG